MHEHSFDSPGLSTMLPEELVCMECKQVVVLERFIDEDGFLRIREVKDA